MCRDWDFELFREDNLRRMKETNSIGATSDSWLRDVAFFVAAFSILRKTPPQPGLLVLGDMSIQGNIKAVRSLVEPLQVAMDNGAKRALIPIENKRPFFDVSGDVLENVDPIFYGDLRQAAFKALGMS